MTEDATPQSLEIRGRPKPVRRIRRSVLAGGAAILGLIVIGSTALALRPIEFEASAAELHAPARRDLPESFRRLPTGYDEAKPSSRLGPPLPGDLGAALADTPPSATSYENPFRFDPVIRPERPYSPQTVQQPSQGRQMVSDARASDIFFVNRRGEGSDVAADLLGAGLGPSVIEAGVLTTSPDDADAPTIQAGTLIPASLVTGLNSDLPGHVVAQVTEPVFDTATGNHLLVPQGSRLIGRYDSDVGFGQSRAFVAWSRIIRPDGSSIALGDMGAVDAAGYAGLSDRIDRHTGKLFQAALLSSVLSVSSELGRSDEDRILDALADGNQRTIGRAGEAVVSRQLDVKPTITIRPGSRLSVLVTADLSIHPYGENQ